MPDARGIETRLSKSISLKYTNKSKHKHTNHNRKSNNENIKFKHLTAMLIGYWKD